MADSLYLVSVTQVAANILKIKFNQPPLASDKTGTYDALNNNNYIISGPGARSVSTVSPLSSDPASFHLTLNSSITTGSWTITVINIQTAMEIELGTPVSLDFTAASFNATSALSGGAVNESPADFIRRSISPSLVGKGWDALIAAIGAGDQYLKQLAQDVYEQLFISTAGGKYLDRLLADEGLQRPAGVGISDDVFRNLGIKINANKLTIESFLDVLEVFYGPDALRATIDSVVGPYNIQNGDDLILKIEGLEVPVTFLSTDFTTVGQATALEVSAAITRALRLAGVTAYAASVLDVPSDANLVRIYSGALGLRGALQVLGGKAQNVLRFPTAIATTQVTGTEWQVDTPASLSSLNADKARITYIGGTDPTLSLVHIGDYANIYGSPFNASNQGAYIITDVGADYFEVQNVQAVAQASVTQIATNDITFFRPTRYTINSKSRISMAVQGAPSYADIILAATTQAVDREPFRASYLHNGTPITLRNKVLVVDISQASNVVSFETDTEHGLEAGDDFYLAPGYPSYDVQVFNDVYTVDTVLDDFNFTCNRTVVDSSLSTDQYIYTCYRDSDGLVTIRTTEDHGYSTGDVVQIDNLRADVNTAPPIVFEATGTLNSSFYLDWAGSVKLDDGQVLVCGGTDGTDSDLAVIYNPDTDTWTAAASMTDARSKHTTTLLGTGRVLVTGGDPGLDTCEQYDPEIDAWVPTLAMSTARVAHTATLLRDGRVFVVGGGSATAEIFDPTAGTWTTVAPPSVDRSHAQATLLNDGTVLISGGYTVLGTGLASAELYNPYNNSWTSVPNMSVARYYHKAINITNNGVLGKALVTGGTTNGTTASATAEMFDPSNRTWTTVASFAVGRYQHSMCLLDDGNPFIYGGVNGAGGIIGTSYVYSLFKNRWTAISGGPTVATHNSILLNNGKILSTSTDSGSGGGATDARPTLFAPQNKVYSSGGLNGLYSVTVVSPDIFTYETTENDKFIQKVGCITEYSNSDGSIVEAYSTLATAEMDEDHIGPYIFDPTQGPAITGTGTTITQELTAGQSYSTITVADASDFPENGGYLVFGFGYDIQTFPIKYLFKISNTQIILDSSFVFPTTLPSGTNVILLSSKGAFVPEDVVNSGAFYVTDSIAGRLAASAILDDIAAVGFIINKYVTFPGQRGLTHEDVDPNFAGNRMNDAWWVWGSDAEIKERRGF